MAKCKFAALTNPDDWANETSRTVAIALGIGKSSVNDHRAQTCICYRHIAPKIHNKAKNVRVLTLDIESKPLISAHWGLFKQNIGIGQIIDHGGLLCFAAKWYDSDEVLFYSEWEHGYDTMLQAAWVLLDQADVLVTYNGIRYDVKKLNWEFIQAGKPKPMPYRHVDLFKVNRAVADPPSRKLDYLAQRTLGDHKTPHAGMKLWMDVMDGDTEAQSLMEEYNRQDVALTEREFDRLRPWLTGVPHLGAIAGVHGSCPSCGSTKLKRAGTAHANVATYKAYRCEDCGTPVRSTTRLQDTTGTRAYA